MPSVNAMLESAKELDAVATESDIQLSINVLFDEPCPWGNFDALMRQRGFKLARNGRGYEFFSNGNIIFNSADLDPNKPVTQLTLLLEIPLIAQDQRAFERMLGEGVEIAQAAHGRLVDDNGINLSEAAVISIRRHLRYALRESGKVRYTLQDPWRLVDSLARSFLCLPVVRKTSADVALLLQTELARLEHAYYVLDNPLLPDIEYDKLYRELLEIEATHPELGNATISISTCWWCGAERV
jgi:hypothetical protein